MDGILTGNSMKQFRENQGWSREDLAKKLGVTAITIYRMEKLEDQPLPERFSISLKGIVKEMGDVSVPINLATSAAINEVAVDSIKNTFETEELLRKLSQKELEENSTEKIKALSHAGTAPDAVTRVENNFHAYLRKFMKSVSSFAEPLVALFLYLTESSDDIISKSVAIGALIYFISPIDAIPDAIPIVGFLDDAAVIAAAVSYYGVKILPYREKAREWLNQESQK